MSKCHNPNCTKEAVFKCAKCHQLKYCCKNCQRDDWPIHKFSCTNAALSVLMRFNMGHSDETNLFVDMFPIGTRVRYSTGYEKDHVGTIVKYKLGKGAYKNPMAKFDYRLCPNLEYEDQCSYVIKLDNSKETMVEPCVSIHDEHGGWEILDAPGVVDQTSAVESEPLSAHRMEFPIKPKFLLIGGRDGYIHGANDRSFEGAEDTVRHVRLFS